MWYSGSLGFTFWHTAHLYVLDGFLNWQISDTGIASKPAQLSKSNDIGAVLDVLKDASATALWMVLEASNGVIVFYQKRKIKEPSQVNFSASTAWSSIAKKIDVFWADEFRNQVVAVGGCLGKISGANNDLARMVVDSGRRVSQDYNLSMSGVQ